MLLNHYNFWWKNFATDITPLHFFGFNPLVHFYIDNFHHSITFITDHFRQSDISNIASRAFCYAMIGRIMEYLRETIKMKMSPRSLSRQRKCCRYGGLLPPELHHHHHCRRHYKTKIIVRNNYHCYHCYQ